MDANSPPKEPLEILMAWFRGLAPAQRAGIAFSAYPFLPEGVVELEEGNRDTFPAFERGIMGHADTVFRKAGLAIAVCGIIDLSIDLSLRSSTGDVKQDAKNARDAQLALVRSLEGQLDRDDPLVQQLIAQAEQDADAAEFNIRQHAALVESWRRLRHKELSHASIRGWLMRASPGHFGTIAADKDGNLVVVRPRPDDEG